jgi:hypothetical protein
VRRTDLATVRDTFGAAAAPGGLAHHAEPIVPDAPLRPYVSPQLGRPVPTTYYNTDGGISWSLGLADEIYEPDYAVTTLWAPDTSGACPAAL